jgi:hypothetical protein
MQTFHQVEVTGGRVELELDRKPRALWVWAFPTKPQWHPPVCPHCGAQGTVGAKFCIRDGTKLLPGVEAAEHIPFDRSHGWYLDVGHDWRWEARRKVASISSVSIDYANSTGGNRLWIVCEFEE